MHLVDTLTNQTENHYEHKKSPISRAFPFFAEMDYPFGKKFGLVS
ncbi:hypothetical protein LEP1GSC196_1826 [Leptospira meyeri serovar Semaranga str. Veldrot Semarang 173]|nr:hypothetical protein LEP1GSC196_1826 [Leptospira meyeri serovar Semaranga str. Veldrot Semarang 173]